MITNACGPEVFGLKIRMRRRRTCNVGPCLETDVKYIQEVVLSYVHSTPSHNLELHGWESVCGSAVVDGEKILKVQKLIEELRLIQPACRFKQTKLAEALVVLANDKCWS